MSRRGEDTPHAKGRWRLSEQVCGDASALVGFVWAVLAVLVKLGKAILILVGPGKVIYVDA